DVSTTNANVSNFSGSGAVYTFDVTASGQGGVSVSVAASAAQDGAGNNSSASNTLSWTYDSVAPTVSLTGGTTGSTAPAASTITASFPHTVTAFTSADVSTTNASVSNFSGSGAVYTFDVTATGAAVSVSVAAGVAQDAAANGNTASNTLSWTYDNTPPTVTID